MKAFKNVDYTRCWLDKHIRWLTISVVLGADLHEMGILVSHPVQKIQIEIDRFENPKATKA
jgi:hypothetical protein